MIRILTGRCGAAFILAMAVASAPPTLAANAAAGSAQPAMTGLPGGPLLVPPANQDLNGVWWTGSYNARVLPTEGGELPFTPAGRAAYQKNIVGLRDRTVIDQARYSCTPDGVPRIWQSPYPFQVFQTPGQTTFYFERNRVIRIAYMDKPLPDKDTLEALPWFSGHSAGKWEGDTLLIETAGFKDSTFLDDSGVPNSDQLRVVERLRKINGGRELELIVTITDPMIFARPWNARFLFTARPDIRLDTQVCGEKLRDISQVRGAVP